MARFNVPKSGVDKTVNYEGAVAYKLSPELELYTAVCCASLQPKFYVSDAQGQLKRIQSLIKKVSPDFVANLAIYAREKMYLRSIPLVLCVELAKIGKLKSETVIRVIQRADEITEVLSYYQLANQRTDTKKLGKLSKAIQKGIKNIFEQGKFDEYQYAKYNRKTEIRLRDALFLTHPKANDKEQDNLFKKIAEDTLGIPYTWETQLSEKGNKKEVWEELIDSKKLPYMATLRNLRNILQADVSTQHLERACSYLSNPEAVKRSRQLPFRYLSAYRELKEVGSPYASFVLEALEKAIQVSAENIEGYGLDTTVLIACDVSGSMNGHLSPRSKIDISEVGLILGMLLQSKCKAVVTGVFADRWEIVQLPRDNILTNSDNLGNYDVGASTNGWKILDWLLKSGKKFDKIMIFTDCQLWNSDARISFWEEHSSQMPELWNAYKQANPKAQIYLFDLAGYGNTPLSIRTNDVHLIAGWSDKIFNVLSAIEKGQSVVDIINKGKD